MPMTPYQSSVPVFITVLTNMKDWLDKAAAQKGEAELLEARLAPDMYPLAKQVQLVSDSAKGCGARLTGVEAPSMPDTEASFAELKERCDKTIAFLESLDPAAIDAGIAREIELKFPNGGGMRFGGQTYLTGFVLPNVYFHASMLYAILRSAGVDIGKLDFLAHLGPNVFPPPEKADA
ncbi:DUF1993 domain-containing protein [Alteraurantiacibacter aquimixticola]|uniref:DUF1993 domain-containing protein n=1 Tax=Alteraurantiacibacter aquimixticola TaxID=2489173 RepID=A0A4T3F3N5_9SPHN|nr:DUF1993 domain-containing protein [Alteraurantiacibacter aquimixticola]TIX51049.1 DUF1993 domain-containing protein [Alteraurantiacibacter aquimixticola]